MQRSVLSLKQKYEKKTTFQLALHIIRKTFVTLLRSNATLMTVSRRKYVMDEIGRTARNVAPTAKRILLFGSQARGDARADSDWDVLVLLDKDRIRLEDIDNISYPLRELGWELGEDINTVLYTVDDWNNNSFTPFYKNVEAEAIPL